MSFPITRASLMLTRNCNLACDFCFNHIGLGGSMSKDIAFKSVDFLFTNASKLDGRDRMVEISFWGGEPLLEWDLLKEVTLYAENVSKSINVPVSFGGTTNGTLLIPDRFSFLDEHKIFFMISIDGAVESHDLFRKFKNGKGSHSIVVKNAKAALKKWPFYRARLSPTAERINHFCEDMKFLFELGFNYLMFSPVYEGTWTEERWKIFENQCYELIDYMVEQKIKGRKLEVEHFGSYTQKDNSDRACGAGVYYCNVDIDGAIEICHRFRKFSDLRPWQEREYCIGHVSCGITRPEVKVKFENPDHSLCEECPRLKDSPCNGGCPAVNYDFNGDIFKPYSGMCRYVEMQKRVSEYYKEKGLVTLPFDNVSTCGCFQATYIDTSKSMPQFRDIFTLLQDLNRRVMGLEEKVNA